MSHYNVSNTIPDILLVQLSTTASISNIRSHRRMRNIQEQLKNALNKNALLEKELGLKQIILRDMQLQHQILSIKYNALLQKNKFKQTQLDKKNQDYLLQKQQQEKLTTKLIQVYQQKNKLEQENIKQIQKRQVAEYKLLLTEDKLNFLEKKQRQSQKRQKHIQHQNAIKQKQYEDQIKLRKQALQKSNYHMKELLNQNQLLRSELIKFDIQNLGRKNSNSNYLSQNQHKQIQDQERNNVLAEKIKFNQFRPTISIFASSDQKKNNKNNKQYKSL